MRSAKIILSDMLRSIWKNGEDMLVSIKRQKGLPTPGLVGQNGTCGAEEGRKEHHAA